jgi:hypothetical protein
MVSANCNCPRETVWKMYSFLVLFQLCLVPYASGDGLRNIASFTADTYFNGNYNIETLDVFITRLTSVFSIQARLSRIDSPGSYRHTIGIGPVINFTPSLYLDARYSCGFDSVWIVSHEAEVNLTNETDTSSLSCGIRGALYLYPESGPVSSYWFLIPTASGEFLVLDHLDLFGKIFVSVNNDNLVSESFWGEAGWSFDSTITLRAGFTLSYINSIGYSVIGGINYRFSKDFILRYTFQFLANAVVYDTGPGIGYGIQNVLIADVIF